VLQVIEGVKVVEVLELLSVIVDDEITEQPTTVEVLQVFEILKVLEVDCSTRSH
jgi:hypothetical protein